MHPVLKHRLDDLTKQVRSAANRRRSSVERERQRLQVILDAAGEGIVFTNRERVIEYANPALAQLTGYTRAEIIGQKPDLWESGVTASISLADLQRSLEDGTPWRGEAIFRRKNGTLCDVALTITPINDERGETIGFVRVQRDITRKKELDRLKDQWVSRIGHELRTPLTNLIIYLTLLNDGSPEKHDHYLLILKREADRMRRLVERFMKLAELTANHAPLEWKSIDLNELVSEVVHGLRERIDQQHLHLRLESGRSLPRVMIDAALISDVISRLLDNALNYTACGGYLTVATALTQSPDQAGVLVTTQDTGPGIPPDELPSLFEGFHRGEAANNFKPPGAGLGLAICRQIIALHHGHIEVESQVNHGSTFKVWLPLCPKGKT